VSTLESTLRVAPSPDVALPVDETGSELKRGAFFNTIALLASNFRGVFTFLVARLLGPAVLGTFAVAWAMTDLISKIGVFGLDDAITTFIARSQAVGDHARSRAEGGPTSVENGQGLCEGCDYAKQAPGWQARPSPDGGGHVIETTLPTGHRYRSRPPPTVATIRRTPIRVDYVLAG